MMCDRLAAELSDRIAALRFRAAGLERSARKFFRIARVGDAVESLG